MYQIKIDGTFIPQLFFITGQNYSFVPQLKPLEKGKLKLLIVDDNQIFINRMICLLQDSAPSEIATASCYEEALSAIQSNNPEVILLDINLPGRSGIDILRFLKENNNQSLVIMISNHDNDYYRELCKQLGAEYFLDKTHDFGMVNTILNKMRA